MFDPNIWKNFTRETKTNYVKNIHVQFVQNSKNNIFQQIKTHGLTDEILEFFYFIILNFNSIISIRFMVYSTPQRARLAESICEEIINQVNLETIWQTINHESRFILIFIWGPVGINYRERQKWRVVNECLHNYFLYYDDPFLFWEYNKYV